MILKHPEAARTDEEHEAPLVLGGHEQLKAVSGPGLASKLIVTAVNLVTLLWLVAAFYYVHKNIGWPNLWELLPHEIGAFFAGVFTPIAFLWLLLAYAKRGIDNKLKGNALDALMRELGYPSPEAEARVASLTLGLRRQSKEVQAETENAAVRISQATKELDQQYSQAEESAGKLLANSDQFQGEMDRRLKLMQDLIAQTDAQKEQLDGMMLDQAEIFSRALKDAEEKGGGLKVSLAEQVAALEEAIRNSEEKTSKMVLTMEKTSQDLASLAERSLVRTENASADITSGILALEESSSALSERLNRQSGQLVGNARDIEAQSRTALSELAKASDMLLQNSSDLSLSTEDAVSRLNMVRDGLSAGTQDVERAIDTMEERQADLLAGSKELDQSLKISSDRLVDNAGLIRKTLTETGEEMQSAGARLRSELDSLTETYQKTEAGLGDVEAVLQQGQKLLDDAGEKSLQNAEVLKGHMADHAESLLGSNEIAASRTKEIQDQLRKQMMVLDQASDQIQALSREISERLDASVDQLSAASLETTNRVVQVGTGFQRQADELKAASERVASQIKDAGEELRQETSDIEMRADRSTKTIKAASEELERKQKELGATADHSRLKIQTVIEETMRLHQDFMATAERATLQARQSGEAAHSQTAELAQTAERASAELRGMGDQARLQLEGLDRAAANANHQMSELVEQTTGNIENLGNASDLATEKMTMLADISERAKTHTETMEKSLREETGALAEIARQLADSAEAVQSGIGDRAKLLQTTGHHADVAGESFRRKTLELAKASELMLAGIQRADQALDRHKDEIEKTRRKVQGDLEYVVSSMADAGRQAAEMGDGSFQAFKGKAIELLEYSKQAENESRALTEQFDQQRQRLEVTAKQVANSINETSTILKSESGNLREAASLAAEEALISSLKFQKEADRLRDASMDVAAQREKLGEKQQADSNAAYRKSVSFILDSLHSLAIDLSRNLDNTMPEELWKRYRRGEKSIFTKRLLKTKDADKIRLLYRENGDFRRYADQYCEAFDRLLKETEDTEHSELLIETYMSSDIGKVFMMLSDAFDGGY
ncbi:coiled-coil domain-containing protein [Sneathiella aquimaris]|uniref:hypothetical protein n=1 Tax=Sneathiella aquimaris TaxID=2599305 RepID=UPI00146C0A8B|nr:hypothetical protein [Sneathiella aquimaris]